MTRTELLAKAAYLAALVAFVAVIAGCGKDDQVSLSNGGSIELIITDITIGVSPAGCPSTDTVDIPVTIITRDNLGFPVNNIAIFINVTWAANSASAGSQIWTLYDEFIPRLVPYRTSTGDFGTKHVTVRVDRGCLATGYIEVFSATARGAADIVVE